MDLEAFACMIPFTKAWSQKEKAAAGPSAKHLQPPAKASRGSIFRLASGCILPAKARRPPSATPKAEGPGAGGTTIPAQDIARCQATTEMLLGLGSTFSSFRPLVQAARAPGACRRTEPARSARRPWTLQRNWSQQGADETLGSREMKGLQHLSCFGTVFIALYCCQCCTLAPAHSHDHCSSLAQSRPV